MMTQTSSHENSISEGLLQRKHVKRRIESSDDSSDSLPTSSSNSHSDSNSEFFSKTPKSKERQLRLRTCSESLSHSRSSTIRDQSFERQSNHCQNISKNITSSGSRSRSPDAKYLPGSNSLTKKWPSWTASPQRSQSPMSRTLPECKELKSSFHKSASKSQSMNRKTSKSPFTRKSRSISHDRKRSPSWRKSQSPVRNSFEKRCSKSPARRSRSRTRRCSRSSEKRSRSPLTRRNHKSPINKVNSKSPSSNRIRYHTKDEKLSRDFGNSKSASFLTGKAKNKETHKVWNRSLSSSPSTNQQWDLSVGTLKGKFKVPRDVSPNTKITENRILDSSRNGNLGQPITKRFVIK